MAACDLGEKQAHAVGIDFGQHERVQDAILGTHGGLGIAVLAHDPGRYAGPYAGWRPGPTWITDATKARLILKHQAERTPRSCLSGDFGPHHAPELFLKFFC